MGEIEIPFSRTTKNYHLYNMDDKTKAIVNIYIPTKDYPNPPQSVKIVVG